MEELMAHVHSEVSQVPPALADVMKVMARGRSRRRRSMAMAAVAALPVLAAAAVLLGQWSGSGYVVGEAESVVLLEVLPGETMEATEQLGVLDTINGRLDLWRGAPAPLLDEGVEVDGDSQALAVADPQVRDDGLPFSDSPVVYLGDNGPVSLFYHARPVGWWDRLLNLFGGGATDLSCLTGVEATEVVLQSCFIDAWVGTSTLVQGTNASPDWAVWLFLPPDTAAVTLETDEGPALSQRPVAGIAVFRLPDDTSGPIHMTALDAAGEAVASAKPGAS